MKLVIDNLRTAHGYYEHTQFLAVRVMAQAVPLILRSQSFVATISSAVKQDTWKINLLPLKYKLNLEGLIFQDETWRRLFAGGLEEIAASNFRVFLHCAIPEDGGSVFSETQSTTHRFTWHHIPEELNLQ